MKEMLNKSQTSQLVKHKNPLHFSFSHLLVHNIIELEIPNFTCLLFCNVIQLVTYTYTVKKEEYKMVYLMA